MIAPHLEVLFCGINPGLWSAAVGHHFARPGNRFWKVLNRAGFTSSELHPGDDRALLDDGIGITNLVRRASAKAAELSPEELRAGAAALRRKAIRYEPKAVAILGVGAFRVAFNSPGAKVGRQDEPLGCSQLWVLPNPSGLQAHYQLADMTELFSALKESLDPRHIPRH